MVSLTDSFRIHLSFARKEVKTRADTSRFRLHAWLPQSAELPRSPVFIVGCPRSGTTLLFSLLRCHDTLRSLPGEGHVLWSAYQHPRHKGWSSDLATADDIRPGEQRYLYDAIHGLAGPKRFLDKTPKNALKVGYLSALFPDAQFVFLKRDGRATVSSLIEGWIARRGISYRLPVTLRLAEYRGRYWSYILPPGWRDLTRTSIAEVAAHQYVSSNEIALSDINRLPRSSVVMLSYEQLVSRPVDEMRRLLDLLDLAPCEDVLYAARNLGRYAAGAITPPRIEKWRDRIDDINRVMPQIAPTMVQLGYRPETSL